MRAKLESGVSHLYAACLKELELLANEKVRHLRAKLLPYSEQGWIPFSKPQSRLGFVTPKSRLGLGLGSLRL